jgi:Abortive infection alpha
VNEQRSLRDDLVEAAPGLARIYAGAFLRSAGWAVEASLRTGARAAEAVAGEPAGEAVHAAADSAREYARRVLGMVDPEAELGDAARRRRPSDEDSTAAALRERGAELLRQSADVELEQETHPAYGRILDDLAPDEVRILRLLVTAGPQPTVNVRSGWLPANLGSELVAFGLSMIGAEAGCRHPERVQAHLNNLFRLGLIWFSQEPLKDPRRYQVLEAQPEVVEAMRDAGHARTVRRSIHLTAFGRDFCDMILPLDRDEAAR